MTGLRSDICRIDVHSHYLPSDLADALSAREKLPRISGRDQSPVIEYGEASGHPLLESMLDIDIQLAEMAPSGIDVAVLSVNVPGELAGRIDYECARFPGGTGHLEAKSSDRIAGLYTDTVCNSPSALRSALELVGPERMMFGSDYPFWKSADAVEVLTEADLSPRVRTAIESANAAHLFGLDVGLAAG